MTSSGNKIIWYHFSDWHQGMTLTKGMTQSDILVDIVNSIQSDKEKFEFKSADFLFFGGDAILGGEITTSNERAQRFCDGFLSTLINELNVPANRVFLVPGNHDVQRDFAHTLNYISTCTINRQPVELQHLGRIDGLKDGNAINKWMAVEGNPNMLLAPFKTLVEIVNNSITGQPATDPAVAKCTWSESYVKDFEVAGVQFIIAGINTAQYSGRTQSFVNGIWDKLSVQYSGRTHSFVRSLWDKLSGRMRSRSTGFEAFGELMRAYLKMSGDDYGNLFISDFVRNELLREVNAKESKAKSKKQLYVPIALMHHPHTWLMHSERAKTKTYLVKNFDMIFHGHEHEPRIVTEFGTDKSVGERGRGTITVSSGACYDDIETNNTTIGYSIVELDPITGKGVIRQKEWDLETLTFRTITNWKFILPEHQGTEDVNMTNVSISISSDESAPPREIFRNMPTPLRRIDS